MLSARQYYYRIALFLPFFVFCLYASHSWLISGPLRVSFLDVGQGDSVLIQTPQGRTVLIDGGPETTVLERLGEETSFWLKTIDLMILTHPDLDHLEGLLEVLQRYRVSQVMMTGVQHHSALYSAFLDLLERQETHILIPRPTQDWQLDREVFLDVLFPLDPILGSEVDAMNDTSVVVKLVYGNTSMLLTGDIEQEAEQQLLLSDYDLSADVLKSGHHGSVTSSSLPFLRAVGADQVIIQAGRENSFGHPHLETLLKYDDLGMQWKSTSQEGTITLLSDGQSWSVEGD